MNLSLIRSMTRSAVFELENGLCYRPAHPFTVTLNGKTVYEACQTNVFSLFSLLPGTEYTVGVQAEGESLTCTFTTEAETFFVDASRYGLVADGTTDNTLKLQAALSTCPKGGTVYVPAGRYRTCSLFLKSNTTLYLEKGGVAFQDRGWCCFSGTPPSILKRALCCWATTTAPITPSCPACCPARTRWTSTI